MSVIGLQGLRGGAGATSLAAALGWALQQLGESVLVIDCATENLLRFFFNIGRANERGWGRDSLDNVNWRESAWRYTSRLDVLPFGQLTTAERLDPALLDGLIPAFRDLISEIIASGRYRWIVVDIPYGEQRYSRPLLALCHRILTVINPDTNCFIRLHQQPVPENSRFLINKLQVASQLQDDLLQLWRSSQRDITPVVVHQDEALAECSAARQPLGEYQPESLAAQEVMTLANWCLIRYAEHQS